MSIYSEKSTVELINRLFQDEDRVKLQLVKELIGRGEEAAAPLREILKNEDYWYEGQGGDYWALVHAIVILSAMGDEKALPILIEMVPHAYFSNHDGAVSVLPAALAAFGKAGIEPYLNFIMDHQDAYRDNPDYSHCRHDFSAALTRIALENEDERQRIADFVFDRFTDPQEEDKVFLGFSVGHPLALDKERGIEAIRVAYGRDAVSQEINGNLDEFLEAIDDPDFDLVSDLEGDLFDFYDPEAIRIRAAEKKREEKERLYWRPSPASQVEAAKVGRNDSCPCGSGKKYKKCCGANQ